MFIKNELKTNAVLVNYFDLQYLSNQTSCQTSILTKVSNRAGQRKLKAESNLNRMNYVEMRAGKQKFDLIAFEKSLRGAGFNEEFIKFIIGQPHIFHTVIGRAHNNQILANIACNMLSYDIDIEERDAQGYTPLQLAISIDQGSPWYSCIVDRLLSEGADIKTINNLTGDSCIHYAAASGNLDIVALGILRGVNPLMENFKGNSAMHSAACSRKNGPEIINLLYKHGVSLNKANSKSETPLYLAAASGNLANVRTLVELGAQIKTNPSALEIAIIKKHHDVAKYLIEKGAI